MSTIEIILTRAMNEPTFADALFSNPEEALAEYNLSVDEIAKFKGLTRTQFEAMSTEDRQSMIAFVGGWGASSYQYAFSGTGG